MKKIINNFLVAAIAGLAVIALFSQCEKEDPVPEIVAETDSNGHSQFHLEDLAAKLNEFPMEELSEEEIAGLRFMREEEKLARDVYQYLYAAWNIPAFDHIAQSEQTHMDAVRLLLDKYDLPDPAEGKAAGSFTDAGLQLLYDNMIAQGDQSEIEALRVGAAIEEVDILDLEEQLQEKVDNQDIAFVYENLQRGSRNHLRAFVRNLGNRGQDYTPQYLSQEVYDEIIATGIEAGGW